MSLNQYLIQNYTQVIDLYDGGVNLDKSLAIVITAEAPVMYTFLSREQLDNAVLSTLPLETGSSVRRVINATQRYLLVKASSPTVLNLTRSITTSVAEMFSAANYFWAALMIGGLAVVAGCMAILFFMHYKKVNYTSPLSAALKEYKNPAKTSFSPISVFVRQMTNEVRDAADYAVDTLYTQPRLKRAALDAAATSTSK